MLGSNKTKGPKQDSQNWSPMSEGEAISVHAETLTTGRMIPSATNSPTAEVST